MAVSNIDAILCMQRASAGQVVELQRADALPSFS
jgi:hypothetical protein